MVLGDGVPTLCLGRWMVQLGCSTGNLSFHLVFVWAQLPGSKSWWKPQFFPRARIEMWARLKTYSESRLWLSTTLSPPRPPHFNLCNIIFYLLGPSPASWISQFGLVVLSIRNRQSGLSNRMFCWKKEFREHKEDEEQLVVSEFTLQAIKLWLQQKYTLLHHFKYSISLSLVGIWKLYLVFFSDPEKLYLPTLASLQYISLTLTAGKLWTGMWPSDEGLSSTCETFSIPEKSNQPNQ